jgi:hypothetical protein
VKINGLSRYKPSYMGHVDVLLPYSIFCLISRIKDLPAAHAVAADEFGESM